MSRKNSSYWSRRLANATWNTYNNTNKYHKELIKLYKRATEEIMMELFKIEAKYAVDGVISRSDFYRANHLMRMEEGFKSILKDLGEEVEISGSKEILNAGKELIGATGDILKDVGIDLNYNPMIAKRMLQEPWKGATFSSRIWKNQNKLLNELNTTIKKGVMTGKSTAQMAMELSRTMDSKLYEASRLVRTETMHHLNTVNTASMKESGIEQVQEVVTLDERTSSECSPHDGLIWDIDKAPTLPRHPNCRCVLVPYIDVDKVAEEFDREEQEILNNLNSGSYSDVYTGASGAKNYFRDDSFDYVKDPEQIRKEEHAYVEYDRIKNSDQKHEINKIYDNISNLESMKEFTKEDVEIAFNHVFNDIHELDDGLGLFKPDYDMAQSWNRLINLNEVQEHDIILLKHERLEHDYMYKDGLDYNTAHDKVSEKYLYKPPKED